MKLEVRTEIRGREVVLVWDGERLTGDPEFVRRVQRYAEIAEVDVGDTDAVAVTDLCRRAVPAPLRIHVTEGEGLVEA
jgi:hypothetical protein